MLYEFWSIEGLCVVEIIARYGVCYLSAKFTTNVPLFVFCRTLVLTMGIKPDPFVRGGRKNEFVNIVTNMSLEP